MTARIGFLLVCVLSLTACETIGTLDDRAQSVNKITANYSAEAILYNIARAKEGEPLNFVSIGSLTGHSGFTGALGLPSIVEGPGRTAAQQVFSFGPNTMGASESSDYTISVVNDPQSYEALLRPVDTATLGFLLNMYYNRDTVFFLFISRIQITDLSGHVTEYDNEPYGFNGLTQKFGVPSSFKTGFYEKMYHYINENLSVVVDPTFVPAYATIGNARFCFDDRQNDFYLSHGDNKALDNPTASHCTKSEDSIYNLPYVIAKAPSDQSQSDQTEVAAKPMVSLSLQQRAPSTASTTGASRTNRSQRPPANNGNAASSNSNFVPLTPDNLLTFVDEDGSTVRVYTRSVLAAYRWLGLMLKARDEDKQSLQEPDTIFYNSPDVAALYVTTDSDNCWTAIKHADKTWCVPNDARETKHTFAMLNQLFELYTSGKDQPVTPTVRLTQ